jgi:Holliday junction resolvase RusA-like endonuclease
MAGGTNTAAKIGSPAIKATSVSFSVPGAPQGKGRPRAARAGTGLRVYTPAETVAYERQVAWLAMAALGPNVKLFGPVHLELNAYFAPPAGASKTDRELMLTGQLGHCRKIDLDNCCKVILDALNGIAFVDDSQVDRITARKGWSEKPRVDVRLSTIGPDTQSQSILDQ